LEKRYGAGHIGGPAKVEGGMSKAEKYKKALEKINESNG
jgi:hypothetical protein